jgi:hypothetical protein
VIVDAVGVPLAISLTGGNRQDVTQLLPLVDEIDQRAGRLLADRGYDYQEVSRRARRPRHRRADRKEDDATAPASAPALGRRARLRLAPRATTTAAALGTTAELHMAFMPLGCAYICQRLLN